MTSTKTQLSWCNRYDLWTYLKHVLVFIVVFIFVWLDYKIKGDSIANIPYFNISTGLILGFLLIFGSSIIPVIAVALTLAVTALFSYGHSFVMVAILNSGLQLLLFSLAAFFARKTMQFSTLSLVTPKHVLFLLLCGIIPNFVNIVLRYVLSEKWVLYLPSSSLDISAELFGGISSISIVTMLLLLFSEKWNYLKQGLSVARLFIPLAIIFLLPHVLGLDRIMLYLMLPGLLYISFTDRIPGAVFGSVMLVIISMGVSMLKLGPFADILSSGYDCFYFHVFIAVCSATSLLFAVSAESTERNLGRAKDNMRRFLDLAETVPAMVYRHSIERPWHFEYVNLQSNKLINLHPEELCSGKIHFEDLIHSEDKERILMNFQRLLNSQEGTINQKYRIKTMNGNIIWVAESGMIHHNEGKTWYDGVLIDVTPLQQEMLRDERDQRLQSLGLLASGVGHDFNNQLAAIRGCFEMVSQKIQNVPGIANYIQIIETAVNSAQELTQNMLTFCRGSQQPAEKHSIEKVLNAIITLANVGSWKRDPVLFTSHCKSNVMVNQAMMQNVILNLITNARDAKKEECKITIDSQERVFDENQIKKIATGKLVAGNYVVITVTDNGPGIPEAILSHIFEPFFTTKERGRGTGLGLSTALGTVREYNGDIDVESSPNGTTFKIYLPVIKEA